MVRLALFDLNLVFARPMDMKINARVVPCSVALVLAVLAYVPSFAPFTPAVLVCFLTLPLALVFAWATPRLAVAAVYWSVATLVVSPMFFNVPGWLALLGMPLGGLALGAALFAHYRRARSIERSGNRIVFRSGPWPRWAAIGGDPLHGLADEPLQEPIRGIEAVTDTEPAQWLVDGLERDWSVITLVPRGFESYARIFHPAWRVRLRDGYIARERVTWTEVASETDRTVHRRMQWRQILARPVMGQSEVERRVRAGGLVFDAPDEGSAPPPVLAALCEVLAAYTRQPDACWFGVWNGFGWNYRVGVPETKSIASRDREWDLFRGPLKAMRRCFLESGLIHQSANLVWPEDRSWCVATEIDLVSTYVGGSAGLISTIVASTALEAWEAKPDDDITDGADRINPPGLAEGW